MRKPRDFDADLKALDDKAKLLKERRLHQLGELVVATGADALPVEQLAGVLLAAVESGDSVAKEGWRKRGAIFFQGSRKARGGARGNARGASADEDQAQPSQRQDRAQ
ncbi:conjugal transfer protein TraD [Nostoc sp. 3335mG]|nr:conjugal transfer protein TraD [Nostoc sp. 3335mG]